MTITLNGTTGITTPDITSAAGLDAADLTGTVASARLPAGSVIQVVSSFTNIGVVDVTWSASAGNPNQYGGLISSRTYVEATSVTITPRSTSSKLVCFGAIGWSNMTAVSTMAIGGIITLNDATAIDISDYPFYPAPNFGSGYWPATHITGTFLPNSVSEQTIRLRPFIYMESGSSTGRYRGYSLIVQEIAA